MKRHLVSRYAYNKLQCYTSISPEEQKQLKQNIYMSKNLEQSQHDINFKKNSQQTSFIDKHKHPKTRRFNEDIVFNIIT